MSAAFFNDQQTLAGQKLGISTAKAIALTVMGLGLGAMNIYHMGNSITSKLLTPDSSIALFILLYFIASCIAFIEVPLTEEIVSQKAKNNGKTSASILGYKLMLTIVAVMAVAGGIYSITTDAQKVDSRRVSHDTQSQSFEDLKQGLISDRNAARRQALSFSTVSQREIETSRANGDYYRALAKLRIKQSGHQVNRPTQAVNTGSIWHWFWSIGFSLLCSIGVIVITAYLSKYHKPLTEIPRVFFKTKENQEWTMNDDDVRVIPAQVDLAGGSSTGAARKALKTPPPAAQNQSVENDPTKPPYTSNHQRGGDFEHSKNASERSLNNTQKGGKVAYNESHYEWIKEAVMSRKINPTLKPVKNGLESLQIEFVNDAARQKKATEILEQLKSENVLIDNPEKGTTGKVLAKYILNSEYKAGDKIINLQGDDKWHAEDAYWIHTVAKLEAGEHVNDIRGNDYSGSEKPQGLYDFDLRELERASKTSSVTKVDGGTIYQQGFTRAFIPDQIPVADESGDSDQVGEFDITTRCGHCGDYTYTKIDELLDNQNGIVECAGCEKKYVAQSHLTSDSNPLTNDLKERAIQSSRSKKEGAV